MENRARSGSGTFNFINNIYKVFIIFILDEKGPERGCGSVQKKGPGIWPSGAGGMETSLSVLLVFVSAFSAVI